ncbi:MAG: hypothetical protein Q6L68_00530 [Thermostichus sp. DG02_5_bins_236]
MSKKADIGSRRLISLDAQGWAQWVTGNGTLQVRELLDSEFQGLSREGDILLRVVDPIVGEFLVANEIQLRYSAQMPRRMGAYAGLAEEKFRLLVYPVPVIILPVLGLKVVHQYESELQGIRVYQGYQIIQLSEVEAQQVFDQPLPTLLPFVPIMT